MSKRLHHRSGAYVVLVSEALVKTYRRLLAVEHINKRHSHSYVSEVSGTAGEEVNSSLLTALGLICNLKSVVDVELAVLSVGHDAHEFGGILAESWGDTCAEVGGRILNSLVSYEVRLVSLAQLVNLCLHRLDLGVILSGVTRSCLKHGDLILDGDDELIKFTDSVLIGVDGGDDLIVVDMCESLSAKCGNLRSDVDLVLVSERLAQLLYGKLKSGFLFKKRLLALKETCNA